MLCPICRREMETDHYKTVWMCGSCCMFFTPSSLEEIELVGKAIRKLEKVWRVTFTLLCILGLVVMSYCWMIRK